MMSQMSWLKPLLLLPLALCPSVFAESFADSCSALASSFSYDNVVVNIAEYVPGGTNVSLSENNITCAQPFQVTSGDLCRLALYVATSNSSGIYMEAWLPQNWTGRFLSGGNGGLNGCIDYVTLGYGAGLGFATVAANNGHNGTSGGAFLNAPEVIADFAYRSVHTGVVVGKSITAAFYGQNYTKSYYLGCSTGGREGFKSAQSFPDDFDGIVAGSPALDFPNLNSWSGWLGVDTGFDNTSASFVTKAQWALVHAEVLRQCDGIDGAVDGIIEDPNLCQPSFETLICPTGTKNTSTCLNGGQVSRIRAVYSPLYGLNGTLVFPRMQPGSEIGAFPIYYTGQGFPYPIDYFRYIVLNDSTWDISTLNLQDVALASAQNPFNIATFEGDLSAYRDKGGKVLHYHGMQDQVITSDNSQRYYHHVAETMNLSPSDLDSFYRYFRISGMNHCSGGPGAWSIGQVPAVAVIGDPATLTAQDNVLLRVVDWVENGEAPETLRGYNYVNSTVSLGVDFSRLHCKFPARNMYVGPGSYKDENAWNCTTGEGY